jgi:site-specific recombinase XerD
MVLTWLAEFLGHDPATATATELDLWQAQLPTINAVRWQTAMIRPYYTYLQARGIRPDNPAALLPRPKARRRLPRPIPEDRLFAAVAEAPPRVLPYLLLAGWSGLRAAEIARLHVEDFGRDPNGGGVWVRIRGKGDAERDVAVPHWVWQRIAPELPDSGPCWSRAHGEGKVTGKQVSDNCTYYLGTVRGLPDRLHSLRHRVATAVLQESHDVRLVQDLLGHANLSTLQVYTKVQPRAILRAVEALPRPARFGVGGTA